MAHANFYLQSLHIGGIPVQKSLPSLDPKGFLPSFTVSPNHSQRKVKSLPASLVFCPVSLAFLPFGGASLLVLAAVVRI